ncbi:hypothetical protein [Pseudoclavibacter sp. AY1F1]|uniref:hypothetical protein n=1 Tax=Pseudoclavibacter sp. AY1F1 TaxID=2080583 RepID=UPI0011B05A59|nr:hypothetical protein [Pseudoclavibacter sp. AY1F1]
MVGPQKIAALGASERAELMRTSVATRSLAFLLLLPVAAVLTYIVSPSFPIEAAVIALGFASVGFSPSWALMGANRPGLILVFDSIPKILLVAGAAVAIRMGASLAVYGLALLAATAVITIAGWFIFGVHRTASKLTRAEIVRSIRGQGRITVSRAITAGFTALPVTLVALVAPAAVPLFTAVDRLARMALSVLAAVPNRLQSWLGAATIENRGLRNRRQLQINAGLGVVAAIGYAFLLPYVATFVFTGSVEVDATLAWLSAGVVLMVCASRGFGLSLVAFSRTDWLMPASIAAAVVGLTLVLSLGSTWGAYGAVLGVVAAEATGAAVQAIGLKLRRQT